KSVGNNYYRVWRRQTTPTHQRCWHYYNGTGAGYFLDLGDGMWLEEECGSVFQLEESTDDYVQLVRTDGGIRVRLPLRGSQSLCKIGDENWRSLYVGRWLSRPELNVASKAVDNLTRSTTTTTVTKQTTPKGVKATNAAEEEQEDMNKSITAK